MREDDMAEWMAKWGYWMAIVVLTANGSLLLWNAVLGNYVMLPVSVAGCACSYVIYLTTGSTRNSMDRMGRKWR